MIEITLLKHIHILYLICNSWMALMTPLPISQAFKRQVKRYFCQYFVGAGRMRFQFGLKFWLCIFSILSSTLGRNPDENVELAKKEKTNAPESIIELDEQL